MPCSDCGGDPVRAVLVRLVVDVVRRVRPDLRDMRDLQHLAEPVHRAQRDLNALLSPRPS